MRNYINEEQQNVEHCKTFCSFEPFYSYSTLKSQTWWFFLLYLCSCFRYTSNNYIKNCIACTVRTREVVAYFLCFLFVSFLYGFIFIIGVFLERDLHSSLLFWVFHMVKKEDKGTFNRLFFLIKQRLRHI